MTSTPSFDRFNGWPVRQVVFPNEERIILAFCWDGTEPCRTFEEANHNIYRLNAVGEVVWQVRRDDSNHPADWWETLHRIARNRGMDGAREPFLEFILRYPDGRDNLSPQTGCPPDVAQWEPGCTIWLMGSAYQEYVLDPETGIAKNVTEGRPRPW